MFEWFLGGSETGSAGLERMQGEFGEMLEAGRLAFGLATGAFLGQTDPEEIRDELFATDKRINRGERQIRKEIVVHASVHGTADFPACLVLMSIVKDAERIGDYSKNFFDLSKLAPEHPFAEFGEDMVRLRNRVGELMATCHQVVDRDQREEATEVIRTAQRIEDHCDKKVRDLIAGAGEPEMRPTYVLAYRYFKRVTAHVRNIASSVVQPVHKLDFTSKFAKQDEPAE